MGASKAATNPFYHLDIFSEVLHAVQSFKKGLAKYLVIYL